MLNMLPKMNIDLMDLLRKISNTPNPQGILQQALSQNPQLKMIFQTWQNSKNPQALLKQYFGNTPQYQQIMGNIEGKTQEEILQYLRNRYKEQGINFDNLLKIGGQFGLIK